VSQTSAITMAPLRSRYQSRPLPDKLAAIKGRTGITSLVLVLTAEDCTQEASKCRHRLYLAEDAVAVHLHP